MSTKSTAHLDGKAAPATKGGRHSPNPERKRSALLAAVRAEKKLLAVMAAAVVVMGIGAHFAGARASAWRREASNDMAKASADDATWQAGLAVRAHGSMWRRRLAEVDAALPIGEDQPGFVSDMAALAGRCGATWSSSSWAPGQAVGTGQNWQVQASVAGSVGSVNCVVSGLATLPRAVSLTALSLSYEAGSMVQAALSLGTFARGGGQG